jgi:hypothetical protein
MRSVTLADIGVVVSLRVAPAAQGERRLAEPQPVQDDLGQPLREGGIDDEQLEGGHRL